MLLTGRMFTDWLPSGVERPLRPVEMMKVGCTLASDGSWKSRTKLLPTCAYVASTRNRSLSTYWSLNLYVGFGPVVHPVRPYELGTAAWRTVDSIGVRSLALRALRSFFENRVYAENLFPLNSCTSDLKFSVWISVSSVFKQSFTWLIGVASATAVVFSAWQFAVGW